MPLLRHLTVLQSETYLPRLFGNSLFLFADNDRKPFAFRAPSPAEAVGISARDAETVLNINGFEILKVNGCVFCKYTKPPYYMLALKALPGEAFDHDKEISFLRRMITAAYELDPYKMPRGSAFDMYADFVSKTARFCGCNTDIEREISNSEYPLGDYPGAERNSAFIVMAVTAIALMYRRLSALRGFNFKVIFADELPCLAFSARITENAEDGTEMRFLNELAGDGGLDIITQISDDKEEGISRFSVGISPQTCDPRGILRAPAWRERSRRLLEKIDIEVKGKY